MIIKKCVFCKKEFTSENWEGHEAKYCSQECYFNYKKTRFIKVTCVICKKEFETFAYRKDTVKCCSRSCLGRHAGNIKLGNVKPRISSHYWFIKKPDYHRANKQGYAKIADLILEEKLGRKLEKNELAHHIDENKLNDSPENLEVMTKKQRLFDWSCKYEKCIDCGTTTIRHWANGRCKKCHGKFYKLKKKYENNRHNALASL